jgi:hypothetical protein
VQKVQSHKYLKIIYITNHSKFVETTINFSETHKIYAVDVTDRNVMFSKTVKIQGSACATTHHLEGLVYYCGYHFTCWIIDESGNIWFHDAVTTGRNSTKEGKFGSVSQPNLKECRNKQLLYHYDLKFSQMSQVKKKTTFKIRQNSKENLSAISVTQNFRIREPNVVMVQYAL